MQENQKPNFQSTCSLQYEIFSIFLVYLCGLFVVLAFIILIHHLLYIFQFCIFLFSVVGRSADVGNQQVRTDNFSNQVQSKESPRKHPTNGSIVQPSTQNILDNNTAQDLLDALHQNVGSSATQQLPRGIDCNPASRIPDETNMNTVWQLNVQRGCSPLKLTGGSSSYDDHNLPQEPAG